jgi:hypothetical protein
VSPGWKMVQTAGALSYLLLWGLKAGTSSVLPVIAPSSRPGPMVVLSYRPSIPSSAKLNGKQKSESYRHATNRQTGIGPSDD